jgi:hypothetical protein
VPLDDVSPILNQIVFCLTLQKQQKEKDTIIAPHKTKKKIKATRVIFFLIYINKNINDRNPK